MTDFRIQMGLVNFGASSDTSTVTPTVSADADRGFPRLANVQHASSGRSTPDGTDLNNDDLGIRVSGWTGSQFILNRESTGENSDHQYRWEVWEDTTEDALRPLHGWYVRGVKTIILTGGSASNDSVAFDDVSDYTRCIPFPVSVTNNKTTQAWGEATVTLEVLSNDKVRAQRDASGTGSTTQVVVALVEFGTAWTINNNLSAAIIGVGGTDYEVSGAGSTLDWKNKFIVTTKRNGGSTDRVDELGFLVRPKFGEDDTILVQLHNDATGVPLTPHHVILHVAHHPLMEVEHQDTERYSGLHLLRGPVWDSDLFGDYEDALDSNEVGTISTTAGPGNLEYPAHCWAYFPTTNGVVLRYRRGRTRNPSISDVYHALQIIRFPRVAGSAGGLVGSVTHNSSSGSLVSPQSRGSLASPGGTGNQRAPRGAGAASTPGAF